MQVLLRHYDLLRGHKVLLNLVLWLLQLLLLARLNQQLLLLLLACLELLLLLVDCACRPLLLDWLEGLLGLQLGSWLLLLKVRVRYLTL